MTEKYARITPLRLGAAAVGVAGLMMSLSAVSGSAAGEPGDGRDPGAAPGAVSDAVSPSGPVSDGRSAAEVAARGQARSATVDSATAAAVLDNGRGAPDPAVGPNPVAVDASRSVVAAETGVDTDSGAVPVPDASKTPAAPPEPIADGDVPGSAQPSQPAGDADTARGSGAPEAPVDVDTP